MLLGGFTIGKVKETSKRADDLTIWAIERGRGRENIERSAVRAPEPELKFRSLAA